MIARLWTHQGCERNGYVDASLPLAGKEEREAGQRAASGRSYVARAGHAATIVDRRRSRQTRRTDSSNGRVVDAGWTDYRSAFVLGAVAKGTAFAAATRKVAIFGFGPPS